MEKKPVRWTSKDDQLFRERVESGDTLIAAALSRTAEELKLKGYLQSFLKWFKRRPGKAQPEKI